MWKYFINDNESIKLLGKAWYEHNIKSPNATLENGSWDFTNNRLSWQGTSVHAAIHLAIYMGCKKIILYGVDYNDRTHFYDDKIKSVEETTPQGWPDFEKHVRGFKILDELAKSLGIRIVNANPNSMLKVFPFEFTPSVPIPSIPIPSIPAVQEFKPIIDPAKRFFVPQLVQLVPEIPIPGQIPEIPASDIPASDIPAPEIPAPEIPAICQAWYDFDTQMLEIRKDGQISVYMFDELNKSKHKQVLCCLKALLKLAENPMR